MTAIEPAAATAVDGTETPPVGEVPARLGPFRLIEPLGRGGMGLVFRARQSTPVNREVALKLLPGPLQPTMLAYFEIERHSLARMQHPAIAQLYEAGTTADGRPWFAMELVPGDPLDVHCERQALTLTERVRLLLRVCRAVQHAHDRGIVHRDLKPSNVLVQSVDGEAMPKLIDFGIASGTSTRARRAGTDAYMSPEQLLDDAAVDTRNDVYAIGVMLCEVLVGLPATRVSGLVRELRAEALELDAASDTDPLGSRLRQQLLRLADGAGDAPTLRRLRGELGYLLVRSIHPHRQRRYASAAALGDDLERLLEGAPLAAHPATAPYLARKFVARHRLALGAAGAVLCGLVLSLLVALNALAVAQQQRDLARAAEAEAARQARIAGSVNRFLTEDLLGAANLDERAEADRLTLLQVVEGAAGSLRSDAGLEPEAEADIRLALGRALASLGRYRSAREHFLRAAELRAGTLGALHAETLEAEAEAADVLIDLSEHAEAGAQLQRLLAQSSLAGNAAGLADEIRLKLARNAIFAGDYGQAEGLLAQVLEASPPPGLADSARRLQAWAYSRTGRDVAAIRTLQRLLVDTRQRFGADSWPLLMAQGALATTLHRAGEVSAALNLREQVVAALRQRFPDHAELGVQLSHLAAHRVLLRRHPEAEAAALEAIERITRQLGAEHRMLGNAHSHLGAALLGQQRFDEAGRALLQARRVFAGALPSAHPLIAQNEERIRQWQQASGGTAVAGAR